MNNEFKSCYAICSHNHGEDACHYLIKADSEYLYGGLENAMIFDSPKEVFDFLLDHPQLSQYGACYIELSKVTLDRIKEAAYERNHKCKAPKDIEHWKLYCNYHTLSYAL